MKAKYSLLTPALLLAAVSVALCQPVITTELQSRTNVMGTDVTFTVLVTGTPPLAYQWRFSTADLAGKTNDTLIVTNVQTANEGSYSVAVTNVDGAVTSAVATLTVLVPPTITRQPQSIVSLGGNATFSALAAGTTPRYFQWRFNETNLPGKTNTSLLVTNVQLTNAGDYTVVVTNVVGSVTSQVAHLEVDVTFTKIATGNIVTDIGNSFAPAWGDFNGDGFVDIFVGTGDDPSAAGNKNLLYENNGDGTFTKVTNGSIVTDVTLTIGATWGDFDNDGDPDLVAANYGFQKNSFYRNDGGGLFTRTTNSVFTNAQGNSHGAVWGDFDNDGRLDLFVTNYKQDDFAVPSPNVLYRNLGDEIFSAIPFANKTVNSGYSTFAVWGDYDNDGDLDLFISNGGWFQAQGNELHRNEGQGVFTRLTNSVVAGDGGFSESGAWGDYDNDGFLDLFVANTLAGNNFLYRNQGDGTFARVTNSIVTLDGGDSIGCAWADYDNDGFLDLFVANFRDFETGALQRNFLYRNNGNSNNWINFKLVGTVSNRSAIGAKVRVLATIGGKTMWQLREISGGSGFGSQNDLWASFGLGDATNVDLVRIEWPSGIVQTLTNVAAKKLLTVEEHQSPGPVIVPSFTSVSRSPSGTVDLSVTGDTGLLYLFEASTNLVNWNWLGARSNATGIIQFTDPRATNFTKRFYRVSVP